MVPNWSTFITDNQPRRKPQPYLNCHNAVDFDDAGRAMRLQMPPSCALPTIMKRILVLLTAGLAQLAPAHALDSLGIFYHWGAFRDPSSVRCYAIAEPARTSSGRSDWRAFAAIGTWPKRGVRGQLHIRLSRQRADNSTVYLSIGERRFALVSGNADAWAQDTRMDAAIIAAMRSSTTMSVEGRANNGRRFHDLYVLRGAATAMDAAALGCTG